MTVHLTFSFGVFQTAGAGLGRRALTEYREDGLGEVTMVARRDHDGSSRVRRLRIRKLLPSVVSTVA